MGKRRTVFLASSHHPTAEQLGNTAVIELDDSQRIIPVIVLAQLRRHSRDTNRGNGLDNRVLTKKPQRQINVMDRAVDEDTTRELRVFDKETARIELVAGLRTEDARATDKTGLHLIECITVGGIEAATETADDLLRGVGFLGGAVSVDYCLTLFSVRLLPSIGCYQSIDTYLLHSSTQWLLAKDVQALVDSLDGLLSMHTGGRSDNDRLQRWLRAQHLIVVEVRPGSLKVCLSPIELLLLGRRDRNDLGARGEIIEMQGVPGTHTAEACDCDLKLGHGN